MNTVVISDEKVWSLYGHKYDFPVILVPQGEACKSLEVAAKCWQEMEGLDRTGRVIGLGGGAVCDLAGFVASTFMRGVELILVPTTLLAMCDAAIGGKTALNFGGIKNRVGTFYEAAEVITDAQILAEMPEQLVREGMAEVVKVGVVADEEFFRALEVGLPLGEIVTRCQEIKRRIVADDPRDRGGRAVLNYGHTLGHAVEVAAGLSHGEAVAIGMSFAARLAGIDCRQDDLLRSLGLPTEIPKGIKLEELMRLMGRDKKVVGQKINFVLPQKIGEARLVEVPREKILSKLLNKA